MAGLSKIIILEQWSKESAWIRPTPAIWFIDASYPVQQSSAKC